MTSAIKSDPAGQPRVQVQIANPLSSFMKKWFHCIWRAVMLFFILANFAAAAPENAKQTAVCVQNILQHFDYLKGEVDGIIGPISKRAYLQLVERFPDVGLPRSLNQHRTMRVCRVMGIVNPSLKQFYPSRSNPTKFYFSKNIDSDLRRDLERLFNRAYNSIEWETYKFVARPSVYFYDNHKDGQRLFMKLHNVYSRGIRKYFKKYYDSSCLGPNGGGLMFDSNLFFCIPTQKDCRHSSCQPDAGEMITTMRHELYHLVQYELLGMPSVKHTGEAVNKLGPKWLLEGSAQFVSYEFVRGSMSLDDSYEVLKAQILPLTNDLQKLERMPEEHSKWKRAYGQSLYATYLLVKKSGTESLLKFYEFFGNSGDWQAAFKEAFGVSVEQFYVDFAALD